MVVFDGVEGAIVGESTGLWSRRVGRGLLLLSRRDALCVSEMARIGFDGII